MGEQALTGIFEFDEEFVLEEASGEVDGQHIIGKIKGPFFVPNGVSRNNRFYSKALWEKQLANPEVQSRLKNRQMFGTISHEQPLDDKAFLEGKVSHIVTKLELKGGLGEALILGTPAGQMLKCYLGAKAKLYTSSRATGKFEGEVNGVPAVDENNYFLKTFDFVTDPGFLQAHPALVEKLEAIVRQYDESKPTLIKPKKGGTMDKEILEQLVKEKRVMEENLSSATLELQKAKQDLIIITDESNHIKDQLVELEHKAELVAAYEKLGTVYEIEECLDTLSTLIESLREIGTIEQISTALDLGEAMGDELKTIKEEFGSLDDLSRAFNLAEQRLEEYEECGTVEQIHKILDFADNVHESNTQTKTQERAGVLAASLKVPVDKILEVYSTFVSAIGNVEQESKLKEFFSGLGETKANRREWTAPAGSMNETNMVPSSDKKRLAFTERMNESRAKRLMGRFQ